jgi:hypothetical protein
MPVKFPNRPLNSNTPNPTPKTLSTTGHLNDAVRADLAKLTPEQRAEVLRVADSE